MPIVGREYCKTGGAGGGEGESEERAGGAKCRNLRATLWIWRRAPTARAWAAWAPETAGAACRSGWRHNRWFRAARPSARRRKEDSTKQSVRIELQPFPTGNVRPRSATGRPHPVSLCLFVLSSFFLSQIEYCSRNRCFLLYHFSEILPSSFFSSDEFE